MTNEFYLMDFDTRLMLQRVFEHQHVVFCGEADHILSKPQLPSSQEQRKTLEQ
jgi:hypothetical protein